MFEMDIEVLKGVMFIHLDGVLNRETITQFNRELNYLLYKQGMNYFVFDFSNVKICDYTVIDWLENKIGEIFFNCGRVVLYGLDGKYDNKICKQDRFFYVREGCEVLNLIV